MVGASGIPRLVSIVGYFFPATAPAAAVAMSKFIDEQLVGAAAALQIAAIAAGTDVTELLMGTVRSLLSGNISPAILSLPKLDLKVNIMRVNCQQCVNLPCPKWPNLSELILSSIGDTIAQPGLD